MRKARRSDSIRFSSKITTPIRDELRIGRAMTLFNKMDLETKKHIRQQEARDDFLKMKKCVEQLRRMEKSLTNNTMDTGYLVDAESHCELVAWQDAGCPEWGAEDDHGEGQADWNEDVGQLAACEKGKNGKGKGKFGKGKGKG